MERAVTFTPRLGANGIYNSKYYYNDNPFHQAGYGLPNCTCYAWGRIYEATGNKPSLPTGNAGTWFDAVRITGSLATGATPYLGAVACWGSTTGGDGHVAVVEVVNNDGSFVISQSGYYRPVATYPPDTKNYFWTDTCDGVTKKASWMGNYYFQGFIYLYRNPTPASTRKKLPIWMMLRPL